LAHKPSSKKRKPLFWSNSSIDWIELFDFLFEVSSPILLEGLNVLLEFIIMAGEGVFEALAGLLVSLF
jgi:hypothetical protein